MIAWYILPPDAQHDAAEAHHDTGGWTLDARRAPRPGTNGEVWLVFDVPDNTPDQNGCWLTITDAKGKALYQLHGILNLHATPESAVLGVDIFPKPPMQSFQMPRLVAQGQFIAQEKP